MIESVIFQLAMLVVKYRIAKTNAAAARTMQVIHKPLQILYALFTLSECTCFILVSPYFLQPRKS